MKSILTGLATQAAKAYKAYKEFKSGDSPAKASAEHTNDSFVLVPPNDKGRNVLIEKKNYSLYLSDGSDPVGHSSTVTGGGLLMGLEINVGGSVDTPARATRK